jgi:acetyl esterase/lipase
MLDYVGMRKWLVDVYMKVPKEPEARRVRTRTSVAIKDVPITYASDNNFSIRVYDPTPDAGKEGSLRPALLMIHGGGWIHGFPEIDEGIISPQNI